jgi:flagellar FliL protein
MERVTQGVAPFGEGERIGLMAKGKASEAAPGDGATAEGGKAKAGKGKLIAIAAAVFLIVGGGAGAYVSGVFGGGETETAAEGDGHGVGKAAHQPVFYALPEMIVTINTGERKSTFLKLKLNIEVGDPAQTSRIEPLLPRVTDVCQVFLRDLRPDDLHGSAGTARLRTELLRRINLALAPIPVNDVLIAEMMIN